jgi:exodeoxyribonuclease-3
VSRRKGHALVCGDLNVAHREVDIKNWKGNIGKAGFLEDERAYFDRWFDRHWVDLGRRLGGEGPGPYTWWSWRGQAFDNDAGWRIDYQIATPGLAGRASAVRIGRAPSYAERWSDHAPVVVDFD